MPPLSWHNNQPYSTEYDDVYFSSDGGLEETKHTFIDQNNLIERWQHLPQQSFFVIGETGFGTGLNFLCSWQLFLHHAPADAQLHFISFEKHPLTPDDLAKSHALFANTKKESQTLLSQYQLLPEGTHRLYFENRRIALTLIIGDIQEKLPKLMGKVDAWFLDGFSPAKNPDMWQPEVLAQLPKHSQPGATFSTFTSSGMVKRGLQTAGFYIEKVAGFGKKREILKGKLAGNWQARTISRQKIAIIGAGLAGSSCAHTLAQHHEVHIFDSKSILPSPTGASGNPIGVLYARLAAESNFKKQKEPNDPPPKPQLTALADFILQGLCFSTHHYKTLLPNWQPCGVLQLSFNAKEEKRANKLADINLPHQLVQIIDATQASALAGIQIEHPALYFPQAGWISPIACCQAWLSYPLSYPNTHPNIHLHENMPIHELIENEKWQLISQQENQAQSFDGFDKVIIATAHFGHMLHPIMQNFPNYPLRGQINYLPPDQHSQQQHMVICGEGYCTPPINFDHNLNPQDNTSHVFGASFDAGIKCDTLMLTSQAQNLEYLSACSPVLKHLANATTPKQLIAGRTSLRYTSPDFFPWVGELAPNLYTSLTHGARGLISTPFAADIIACQINNEPLPINQTIYQQLDPLRFTRHVKYAVPQKDVA